jgi:F0F1-type ATP synthase membrane subunit c/vacuolar-type H+-ATPase subunit K/ribosomal protein L37E
VPIYSDEAVAGALELYGAAVQAFAEQDVHTCQLMAGLVTEALAQDEDLDGKKSAANERAMMAESLEKLQPNLAALADTPEVKEVLAHLAGAMAAPPAPTFACRKCGHQLMGEEQFCGKCGTPRSSDYEPPTVQSKVASLWHMQEALRRKNAPPADSNADAPSFSSVAGIPGKPAAESNEEESIEAESIDKEMPDFSRAREWRSKRAIEARRSEFAEPKEREPEEKGDGLEDLERGEETAAGEAEAPAEEALVKHSHPWSSAASARDFFEQLAKTKERGGWAQIWSTRRGDFYLTIAVILVIAVIGWGILSSHAGPGAHNAAHKPGADLSLFDRMLISLGLAEAPPPPEYKGNPSTQVWVDLQTALYYCPGADLYGKTPKGKFTTQRAAQLDQFEPASRKACD